MRLIERLEAKAAKRIVIYDVKSRDPKTGKPDCKLQIMSKQLKRKNYMYELLRRYVSRMEYKLNSHSELIAGVK